LIFCCFSCAPDVKEKKTALKYFDVKGFFKKEINKFNRQNNPVLKTITYNGASETKKVKISNWGKELSFFELSDINKPAWNDSYSVEQTDEFLIYRAKFPELKMREMVIKKENQKIKWILIGNLTKNMLYQTSEKLTYYPDSVYLIEKRQKVRFLGINTYSIKGTIVKYNTRK